MQWAGGLPGGAEIIFDYAEPAEEHSRPPGDMFRALAERVASAGEPFVTFHKPSAIDAMLNSVGYRCAKDYTFKVLVDRYVGVEAATARARAGSVPPDRGGHIAFASTHRA